MQVLFFGSPGVGKGTQAKIISERLNLKHISTGDILRDIIKKETELGQQIKALIDKGNLVPDNMIGEIVKETISQSNNNFILDGYPRTVPQIAVLEKILQEMDIPFPQIVILDALDEIIIERLTSRRLCNSCGNIISLLKMAEPETCPKCNSKAGFTRREDDREEVISKRLQIFHETTEPVVSHYRKNYEPIIIDGTLPKGEVTQSIIDGLVKEPVSS